MMNSAVAPWPHSAGRSLAVLVGTVAVLWVWWQIPGWYQLSSTNEAGLAQLVHLWQQVWLLALWVAAANAVVLYRATLPLALPSSPGSLLDTRRYLPSFVFWLCVVFHLGSLLGLLLLGAGIIHLNPLWL